MAKKSRKTRRDRRGQKKHEFNPWISPTPVTKSEGSGMKPLDRNKPQVANYVYKDLKKIIFLMGCFVVGLVALALLTHFTDLLNPLFAIFHIKY
jgi:hypothetical protein